MSRRFDIAVVGGGMSGAAAAVGLASGGWSVVLVDAGPAPKFPAPDLPPLARVSTLTPAVLNVLQRLGASAAMDPARIQAFDTMRVWENDPELELVFRASDADFEYLGKIAENEVVRAALWQVAAINVDLRPESGVTRVSAGERGVRLELADDSPIECDLLVAADGARSVVREALGIETEMADYSQSAVVATVQARSHADTAWQRFLPGGPLAFLPLPGNRCSVVWSCSEAEADRLLKLGDPEFLEELDQASERRLDLSELVGQRASFPLRRMQARNYQCRRAVLLGDAAHVVHPLAGQGANMGILDAAALVETLKPLRKAGRDPSHPPALRAYARWRRSDNAIVAAALHQIWRLYGIDTPTARGMRLLGARFLNGAPWVRRRLIEHASGFGGQVPELARTPRERSAA